MRRRDEVLVGATIIASLAAIIFGALYLSSQELGQRTEIRVARFRTTGGLGVGAPLTLRGVRVGSVNAIELGDDNLVQVSLKINEDNIIRGMLPERPAVIVASASLFGEWEARLISLDFPPDDPNLLADLQVVMDAGDDGAWPGATLPDIGELTAQASRIAGNITDISERVTTVLDDQAVGQLQQSIRDFANTVQNINEMAAQQRDVFGTVSQNVERTSNLLAEAADRLQLTLARIDTATSEGELATILDNTAIISTEAAAMLGDLGSIVGVVRANEATISRLFAGADTILAKLETGRGTAGLLLSDSLLYQEATLAISELRLLIADIQANPRKYFKFSVF